MTFLLYLFGFLPSIIWLSYYLRKDKHPEPNKMVLLVFFLGMAAALVAVFAQLLFKEIVVLANPSLMVFWALNIFIGAGIIEETAKFFAVKFAVLKNKALDEPADLLIYMIIAALGFAALENILYLQGQILNKENLAILSNYHTLLPAKKTVEFIALRFISATFLHALCSGFIGYFLALSFYHSKNKRAYLFSGIIAASALHGLYNWALLTMANPWNLYLPIAILIFLSCFVSFSFKKLKKLQSTCQIYD